MLSDRPHLKASLCALGCVATLFVASLSGARWIETRSFRAEAPQTFSMKNNGIVLQREAFRRPGVLPLYGSSELVKEVPGKAAAFFSRAPTGFEVFPVGKAGTASLIALEKLAAVGGDLSGRKLAFSISPSWFWAAFENPSRYAGNFSIEQANALVFKTHLDPELRRDIARRMLDFPGTIEHSPVLAFALRRLAGDTWLDRAGYWLACPMGRVDGLVLQMQDHIRSALHVLHHVASPFAWRHRPIDPKWSRLLAGAERADIAPKADAEEELLKHVLPAHRRDAAFRAQIANAGEWRDLELLLRTLHALGAHPLLLSMPLDGEFFDRFGVSAEARAEFYDRLEALAQRYDFPLVDFREHDQDRRFLAETHDHLSAEGWLYYDAALDAFYHDRAVDAAMSPQRL